MSKKLDTLRAVKKSLEDLKETKKETKDENQQAEELKKEILSLLKELGMVTEIVRIVERVVEVERPRYFNQPYREIVRPYLVGDTIPFRSDTILCANDALGAFNAALKATLS